MSFSSSVRVDDLFSGDDHMAFVTFEGCMKSKIASVGRGTSERPFDQLFWFNEVEKLLSGSAKDTYVASRSRILSMRQYFSKRDASARVANKKSKAPTYDVNLVRLTEGTLEVIEVEAIDWRSARDFPIENPFDVLMLELESQFRYNNERAMGEIRNHNQ